MGELPVILLELNSSGNIAKTYIYGNSQILVQHDGGYSASRYFYLHDRLGSVRQIINSSANVVNYYTYNPFGEILETSETFGNPFLFAGYWYDAEIGDYDLRNRRYNPHIYRFTSRDIVDGKFDNPLSLHKYLYCQNEPVNRIDPTGLWWEITHRQFGMWGWGNDEIRGSAPFDYARLDIDMPAFQYELPYFTDYTELHFRSRREVYKPLIIAAAESNIREFEYLMHQWQDSYVHWDRGFRWWAGGHAWNPSVDDPQDPVNIRNRAQERCDYTTRELEKVWFKYNIINDDNPLASWIDNPFAELPAENPWLAIWQGFSPQDLSLINYSGHN